MRRIIIVLFIPLYLLLSVPFLLVTYIASLFSRDITRKFASIFCRSYSVCLLWLMGADLQISGLEHIDEHRNYLFVSNHTSLIDSPALMILTRKPLSFISKMEMKKAPIFSNWMFLLHCLFLDRNNNREGLKTILQGIENMKNGDYIAIFPQGTRSKRDEFLAFKAGSFKLATKANVPVLPIAIYGTDAIFENNGFNFKPGNVHIHVFAPIETKGMTMTEQKNLSKQVENMIHEKFLAFKAIEAGL